MGQVSPQLVAGVAGSVPKAPVIGDRAQLPLLLLNAGVGDQEGDQNEAKGRRKRVLGSSSELARSSTTGPSRSGSVSGRATPNAEGRAGSAGAFQGEQEEERDENLYCFCQRGSFGEMIGCDSDDCKYEWFHIGCVGVSKPLPQTWVCGDCLAKNKKQKRSS